jgi:hypothetical protein
VTVTASFAPNHIWEKFWNQDSPISSDSCSAKQKQNIRLNGLHLFVCFSSVVLLAFVHLWFCGRSRVERRGSRLVAHGSPEHGMFLSLNGKFSCVISTRAQYPCLGTA